ncbi:sporulation histidine kinase inhibitor Sda [Filobacillus milosensis]|uniref:Sporulation histidine kinase inhibitor Sda n=1 Tax=Filobacillus milosensis TaxID=94137 RepID=A0A4Y8IUV4_9BACI|nr:sporulation histidine kinase inhibitor Sda [Filobacillus milosensis]TFB24959.1 sporulation histidine kinase inhibitor Sda [Filobacillus milosensis]
MHRLSNDQLIDTYVKALDLNLDQPFIVLLESEVRLRGIDPNTIKLMIG